MSSSVEAEGKSTVPEDLLEILVCPIGKKPLRVEGDALVCTNCGVSYSVEDGIPNMLIDEAALPDGVSDVKQLACYSE